MNVFPRATSERFSRRPTVGKWLKPHLYAKTFSSALRRAGKLVKSRREQKTKNAFFFFFSTRIFFLRSGLYSASYVGSIWLNLSLLVCLSCDLLFLNSKEPSLPVNYSLIRDPKALCLLLVEGLSGLNVTLILTEDALSVYSFLLHSFSLNWLSVTG